MKYEFNGKKYKYRGGQGFLSYGRLCFDIFKKYLYDNADKSYEEVKKIFNSNHCDSKIIVQIENDWALLSDNQKERYFEPILYNGMKLYFSTQWGNNGIKNNKNCDNVQHMIDFAKSQNYEIKIFDDEKVNFDDNDSQKAKNENMKIKNIMLYGAPGVGKTYNYKKLISMIEECADEKTIFDTISKNKYMSNEYNNIFQTIKNEERVEFITFHQSYSYEDFIEGFRPSEDKIVRKDGIFKIILDKAMENLENSQKSTIELKSILEFKEIFDEFKDFIQDEIDTNNKFFINETAYIINVEENAFRYTGDSWGNTQRMKFSDIELLYDLNIFERKEIKKVKDISGLAKQHSTYFAYFIKKLLEFKKNKNINITNVQEEKQKNFYIVIDEINRGNISKIFGELITLIEEDKRGKKEYEVTLPYSKDKFLIPENLYIIATMNSTDKSIATIDIALRRRFTFLKMKPNIDLVPEKAKDLFKNLNQHITKSINEDYQIGHSYFMNDLDIDFIKEYKIKPLLEEYFYGDDENYKKAIEILEKY